MPKWTDQKTGEVKVQCEYCDLIVLERDAQDWIYWEALPGHPAHTLWFCSHKHEDNYYDSRGGNP